MPSDSSQLLCLYCLCPIRIVNAPDGNSPNTAPYHDEVEPYTTLWPQSHYKDVYNDTLGWFGSCPSAGLGARGELGHYRYSYRLMEEVLNGIRSMYCDY